MKRWRREPRETGLRSGCQGVRGYEYRENGQWIAKVAPLTRGFDRYDVTGWYWYGDGINTASRNPPYATAEDAMKAATDHFANAQVSRDSAAPERTP